MSRSNPALLALALAALLAPAASIAQTTAAPGAKPIPIQDFVRHPRFQSAKISPNGKYLAITAQASPAQNSFQNRLP